MTDSTPAPGMTISEMGAEVERRVRAYLAAYFAASSIHPLDPTRREKIDAEFSRRGFKRIEIHLSPD